MAPKTILIDARGLNYLKETGINVYTLNILHILNSIATEYTTQIQFMGIKDEVKKSLITKYPWLADYITASISLKQYLGIPKLIQPFFSNKLISALLELSLFVFPRSFFDWIWRPQAGNLIIWQPLHKALPIHPSTKHYITSIHDLYALKNSNGLLMAEIIREHKRNLTKTVTRATIILAVSYATGFDVQRFLTNSSNKIKVVYSGYPNSQLSSQTQHISTPRTRNRPKKYFLCISGIEPRKNWFNIVLAHHYNNLHRSDYECSLLLVGIPVNQKYYQDIKALINQQKIDNVTIIENATDEEKNTLLQHCIGLVYASLYEGFGFPILEAFRFNKPVITSQVSSMPEIARTGGMLVNPFDIVDIANAMHILSQDSQFRDSLICQIPQIRNQFGWDENIRFWREILSSG